MRTRSRVAFALVAAVALHADAFTATELAALNARRTSSARFAPYG